MRNDETKKNSIYSTECVQEQLRTQRIPEERASWRKRRPPPLLQPTLATTAPYRNLPHRRRRRQRGPAFQLLRIHPIRPSPWLRGPPPPPPPPPHQAATPVLAIAIIIPIIRASPTSGTWRNGTKSGNATGKRGSTTRNGCESNRGSTNTQTFASTTFSGKRWTPFCCCWLDWITRQQKQNPFVLHIC